MNAVDTNVLLYSVDSHEPAKRALAMQLLRRLRDTQEPTVLLWQVLCETTCQLRPGGADGFPSGLRSSKRFYAESATSGHSDDA